MSANAAAKKQKPLKRHPSKLKRMSAYMILTLILISIVAVLFAFPLYWIITGSFKTGAAINATTPEWWPSQWVLTNYQKLFSGKSAPLWQLAVPFGSKFSANGEPIYFSVGPTAPAAIRWMINTVFMAVMSMILTCITAAMAGYALAKKAVEDHTLAEAVLLGSDEVAEGALEAFRELGIRVPKDVAVIIYQDIQTLESKWPTGTCLEMFPDYVWENALELLFGRISQRRSQAVTVTVPTHLKIGDTA